MSILNYRSLGAKVDGYILGYEAQDARMPQLIPATVNRAPTPGLYVDQQGSMQTLGVTFFIHEYPAYLALRRALKDEKEDLLTLLGSIERELKDVDAIISSLSSEVRGE